MRDAVEDLRTAGAALAAVGTGDPAYARHFAEERDIRFPLLVDEQHVSYRAVSAGHARLRDLARPSTLVRGAKAMASGARQGRSGPAPLLLGATHVLRPDGSVALAWVNDDVADNAPIPEVLAALR